MTQRADSLDSAPLVSIVIPCYNQGRFLSDCIASLQAQTVSDWEALIINDGSPDNTRAIAKSLCSDDPRLRYFEQENAGACVARNTGIRQARGEFIQLLDADDRIETRKLELQLAYLRSHPEVDIVFGDARYFTTENPNLLDYGFYSFGKNEPWIPKLWSSPGRPIEKFLERNLFPINCPLVRSRVYATVGEWNNNLERLQDWEYWIRCVASGAKIEFLDALGSMALIRWHSESMSHDAEKGARATIVMRTSIGKNLQDPQLKRRNFEIGLRHIVVANVPKKRDSIIALARANFTPSIVFVLLKVLLIYLVSDRLYRPVAAKIFSIFKKWTPWPVQKLLFRVFGKKRNQSNAAKINRS